MYIRVVYTYMNTTKIKKWGNSLGVRIPVKLCSGFNENTTVNITRDGDRIIIEKPSQEPKDSWKQYLIPSGNKTKRDVSKNVDKILYGKD